MLTDLREEARPAVPAFRAVGPAKIAAIRAPHDPDCDACSAAQPSRGSLAAAQGHRYVA